MLSINQIRGPYWGLVLGDALGRLVEFQVEKG